MKRFSLGTLSLNRESCLGPRGLWNEVCAPWQLLPPAGPDSPVALASLLVLSSAWAVLSWTILKLAVTPCRHVGCPCPRMGQQLSFLPSIPRGRKTQCGVWPPEMITFPFQRQKASSFRTKLSRIGGQPSPRLTPPRSSLHAGTAPSILPCKPDFTLPPPSQLFLHRPVSLGAFPGSSPVCPSPLSLHPSLPLPIWYNFPLKVNFVA